MTFSPKLFSLVLYNPPDLSLIEGIYIDAPRTASISRLGGIFGASAILRGSYKLSLPPGPYFVSNTDGVLKTFKAFRIYPDTQRVPSLFSCTHYRASCMGQFRKMMAISQSPLVLFW